MAAIGRLIEKDPTTVSKEVKKYRSFQPRAKDQLPLKCARFKECTMRFLCDKMASSFNFRHAWNVMRMGKSVQKFFIVIQTVPGKKEGLRRIINTYGK